MVTNYGTDSHMSGETLAWIRSAEETDVEQLRFEGSGSGLDCLDFC